MKPNDAALRKRTQIAKANKAMFLWIAAASALVGAAVVVSIFLFQKLSYNEKVLSTKQTTSSTITSNIQTIKTLEEEIRILDTNSALASIKANESDQTLQVILDALPSEANSNALGASLQNKLLGGVPGLTIDTLQIDPVVGVESLTRDSEVSEEATTSNAITFQFTVTGSQDALQQALQNLQRSIRTIEIVSVSIEIKGSGPVMTVQAKAYYEPTTTLELKEEVVKP